MSVYYSIYTHISALVSVPAHLYVKLNELALMSAIILQYQNDLAFPWLIGVGDLTLVICDSGDYVK
jgi:hypothetical protein